MRTRVGLAVSAATEYGACFGILKSGDFNGDGIPDLVCPGSSLQVFYGIGDGGLRPAVSFGVGTATLGEVTVGDFNRDGLLDLAVGNFDQAPLLMFLGGFDASGIRTFSETGSYGTYRYSGSVRDFLGPMITLDLNGDGLDDLAMASTLRRNDSMPPGIAVLLGQGDGTFGGWTQYQTGYIDALAASDLAGDGTPRLLFSTAGSIGELAFGPDGGFAASMLVRPDGGYYLNFRMGNFNGDHAEDLATDEGSIFLNGCP